MLNSLGKTLTATFRANPIFIVGLGRSGTAVLKYALGSHPQIISCDGEAPLIGGVGSLAQSLDEGPTASYRTRALRTGREYTIDQLRRLCFESAMGRHWGLKRVLRETVRARKLPFGLRRWCAKTFPTRVHADGIATLYPSVRFVYIFRSGSDVLRSRTHFGAMRERSFEDHCREWAASVDRYAFLLESERAISIRQEQLASDPDAVLTALLAFLGVDAHPGPATFAETTLVHPLDEPTQIDVPVEQRLRERAPAHEAWSESERETFKALCSDAMHKLGYDVPF